MSYPKFGTHPIRCGKSRCKWRGFETQLIDKKEGVWTHKLCPVCSCDSYQFMTPGEISAWERKREAAMTIDTPPQHVHLLEAVKQGGAK